MPTHPQKLPIGLQSFKSLREGDCLYVDKTQHIHTLINGSKYQFLSRPRRFGKSLLIDTMRHLFESNRDLFTGLWIYDHWDWDMRYPVVRVTFGSAGTSTSADLKKYIEKMLLEEATRHGVTIEKTLPGIMFRDLIITLNTKYQEPVVVLIDEYDKPILDNITNLPVAHGFRDILKGFYGVLKDSDEYLRFVLLTGVSKFSKVSLFSGLNNLEDVTLAPECGTICGMTEGEILNTFSDYLDDIDLNELRKWYNGFNFLGREKVYNPYDLLLFFKRKEYSNYWFETATPTFLIKKLAEQQYYIPAIEHIEVNEHILGSFDIETLTIETLLFQTGYLTIKDKRHIAGKTMYTLQYPNYEIKTSLTDNILDFLVHDVIAKDKNQVALFESLNAGNLEHLEQVFRAMFSAIPHDWFRKNKLAKYEGYYSSVVYSYCCGMGLDVIAEDTTNKGRIDLTIREGNAIYIIEFKVEKNGKSALEQIRERKYWEKYLSTEKVPAKNENTSSPHPHHSPTSNSQPPTSSIYLVGIEFDETERNITSFSWEKVEKSPL